MDSLVPAWMADAVFYQIFPERFANANPALNPPNTVAWDTAPTPDNFLGGDLEGIRTHLDHIQDLGANALYLTPIFAAGTNHRYDATDYFRIDPHLGTEEDFDALVADCHGRGIRVVLDAVLNHCGIDHWAFRDVREKGYDSPYATWFSVDGFPITPLDPNYKTCSGCWYMPKWNVYNPEVRAHHLKVARHWLDRGIDGWRLDVPYYVPMGFWREFRDVVRAANPEACIIAEDWRSPAPWLDGTTADGTMNYTLRDLILGFTADGVLDAAHLARGIEELSAVIPTAHTTGMLNLLGSHDTERVLTRHRGHTARLKMAYALLLTSPGTPMIYYGDEIGMAGENDPGCRAGMIWDESAWDVELRDWIRALVRARVAYPAVRTGQERVWPLEGRIVARTRTLEDEVVGVVANREWYGIDVDLRTLGMRSPAVDVVTGSPVTSAVHVPADGTAVVAGVRL